MKAGERVEIKVGPLIGFCADRGQIREHMFDLGSVLVVEGPAPVINDERGWWVGIVEHRGQDWRVPFLASMVVKARA